MSEEKSAVDPHFASLVIQLQSAAWIHMGKVADPSTGKVDRNLDAARGVIDMLGMIETKTRGNLQQEEENLLRELLRQLRLNFVSEQSKPAPQPAVASDSAPAKDEAPSNEEAPDSQTTDSSRASDSSEG